MNIQNQPKLRFLGVDFVNINFRTEQQYDGESGINLNVEPKVFYPEDDQLHFKIFMEVSLDCESFFSLKLIGIGNFQFDKDFDDEELKKAFVNANAPAIMFPYVRSFITTLSSNLGSVTGPLIIPTQLFMGELPELDPTQNQ
ncbi:MAG: hypothetical protein ACOC4B_01795 [Bacteroidota bacterium]